MKQLTAIIVIGFLLINLASSQNSGDNKVIVVKNEQNGGNREDSYEMNNSDTWSIPDNGYRSVVFDNNNFAPDGAIVTRVRYVFFIDDQGDSDNFWCGDYEVWMSSSMTYGNVYEDVNVYNNLGLNKDEGFDDDFLNDTDIDTDWGSSRETHYFDGEPANQYWGIRVKDTYGGDVGQLENFGIRVYWEIVANNPPTIAITSGPSGTIDYDDVTFTWQGYDSDGSVSGYEYE
ncbi:MAG: hypothetical protein KQH67_00005, partial [Bacteroidetes bacterium]|nr:hypothetical protein [Bacteroidota bacterium]